MTQEYKNIMTALRLPGDSPKDIILPSQKDNRSGKRMSPSAASPFIPRFPVHDMGLLLSAATSIAILYNINAASLQHYFYTHSGFIHSDHDKGCGLSFTVPYTHIVYSVLLPAVYF